MIDYAARRQKVRATMAQQGVDLLAVAPGQNMYYLLGFFPHPDERPTYLFLTPEREGFLCPELNAGQVKSRVDVPMERWADETGPAAALARIGETLGFAGVKRVMVDDVMRADFVLLLLGKLPAAKAEVAAGLLGWLRMQKDAAEIDLIQRNAELADRAMEAAWRELRPGMTERQVADLVVASFTQDGVEGVDFAIIGSGPNGAFPHHDTGDRVLQTGDAVVMDIGAKKWAYHSDITRMAFLGEPTAEYLKVHQIVDEAVRAAAAAVKPGVPASVVDKAARAVITAAGYGEYFTHRTGHGLGLDGHEPPYMTSGNELVLEEGMVFSIEPGIYLPGKFGVRLEEIVTVTAQGARIFSRLPRDLFVKR
jgi:Xaa-Pro aminopeptidase